MDGNILFDQSTINPNLNYTNLVSLFIYIEWESLCRDTLEMMARSQENAEYYWPRDSMFKYLQSLETFMENIAEYQELSLLARKILLQLHDS